MTNQQRSRFAGSIALFSWRHPHLPLGELIRRQLAARGVLFTQEDVEAVYQEIALDNYSPQPEPKQ